MKLSELSDEAWFGIIILAYIALMAVVAVCQTVERIHNGSP